MANFLSQIGRLRAYPLRKQLLKSEQLSGPGRALLGLAAALALAVPASAADVWGYIDDKGVAHFASQKLNDRYELFFMQASTPQLKPSALPQAAAGSAAQPRPAALPALAGASNPGAAAAAASKTATFFDLSAGYKAVRHLLRDAAKRHNLDYDLLKALIVTESGFNPLAISPKGAVGLMQLMPPTAARYGVLPDPKRGVVHKLVDPATNIAAGSSYLRYLINLFPGRLDLAVAAYNAGEGAVQRSGNQIPPYKETQNYVTSVLRLYTQLKPPGFRTDELLTAPAAKPELLPQTAAAAAQSSSSVTTVLVASGDGARVRVQLPGALALPSATSPTDAQGSPNAAPAAVGSPNAAPTALGSIPGRGNMVPAAGLPLPGSQKPAPENTAPASPRGAADIAPSAQ